MSAPVPEIAPAVTVMADTIIDATPVDYLMIFLYFGVVLGIGPGIYDEPPEFEYGSELR